jgi:hypothetical protein
LHCGRSPYPKVVPLLDRRRRKSARGGLAANPEGGEPAGQPAVDRPSEKNVEHSAGYLRPNDALWVVALVGHCKHGDAFETKGDPTMFRQFFAVREAASTAPKSVALATRRSHQSRPGLEDLEGRRLMSTSLVHSPSHIVATVHTVPKTDSGTTSGVREDLRFKFGTVFTTR